MHRDQKIDDQNYVVGPVTEIHHDFPTKMPSQIQKRLQLRQKSIQVDDKKKYADLFDFVDKKY